MPSAIIIGSGIAGMATALHLRAAGFEVDVFESNDYPGGKLHAFEVNGYRFDAGPSLFTMPQLITELFELFGEQPTDFFQYHRLKSVCNYFWEDGMRFTVDADRDVFAEEAAAKFGIEATAILSYLKNGQKKYELTAPLFIEKSLHKMGTYLSVETLKAMAHLSEMNLGTSLDALNEAAIGEPHLVQLFNRYATYNGSSPYLTPGIMSMIPHLELYLGAYYPNGGMHSITTSLYQLALRQGIRFHFNQKIEQILVEKNKAIGVKAASNQHFADCIVSNMDVFSTYKKLLASQPHPERTLRQERSSSAVIFYWGIRGSFTQLDLHNIFFSSNYQQEFAHLFEHKSLFNDPTVYVNITSKETPGDAPEGCENWFVMINAPGDYGQNWETLVAQARQNIISKLNRLLGTDIAPRIMAEDVLTPPLIEKRTSSYRGALYGAASNSKLAAFLRHPNFSNKIKQLYFCGGSVHPGGGIPLCMHSAKITSKLIISAL
ncbi:1-hydroxycarotenoid 3,4-desaturase CrtD [Dyadobacter sandarakinus]|uniref:Phytoene desaturase n=1 Tax=Dyadobacter sandarakinus TaxID=2747268 RepID=A0ABX7I6P5_9BACT|nr:1-hydroxycarotenoid 3,4-desaturase CrtD [Dyadobacter sandarakinus]QRR01465.1 phytoene desaturase [Dyadobacter sandarakinus]